MGINININNKDDYYMNLAFNVAKISKCVRAKYGTVIVSEDGRIVSTGYNGKPRGSINDHICYREGLPDNSPKPNCCLHSETNALLFCSPEEIRGSTLYVNGIPCTDCVLKIAQMLVSRVVYYKNEYGHRGNFNNDFHKKYGIRTVFEQWIKS